MGCLEGGKYFACQVAVIFNIVRCWVAEVSEQLFIEALGNDSGCKEWNHILFVDQSRVHLHSEVCFRESFKYYFADFVRKGGGGGVPPKSITFFLAKILSVKGGVPPLRTKSAK